MMTNDPVCPLCNGSGWAPSLVPDPRHATAKFSYDPPVERCICVRARDRQRMLDAAGIPPEYRGCTFDNFRTYTDRLIDALALARGLTDHYPVNDPKGLLLIGPAGVGKTHLAAAILQTIIARTGFHGRFCKMGDLLRAMRDSYNPAIQTTERQILDPVLTCDLLVLDDLGRERLTEWVLETMELIIDTRYSAGLSIIVTTNYADVDNSEEINGLWYRIGFRNRSRLHKMCRPVTLDGTDYRDVYPETPDADLRKLAKQREGTPPARDLRRGPKPTPKDGKADLNWSGGKGGNT